MSIINRILLCLVITIIIVGCRTDIKETQAEKVDTINYINLVVLLDMSDRLMREGQIERDTLIIRTVVNEFADQVKKHGYQYSKDKLQVLIAPQAGNKVNNYNPYIDIDELVKANKIVRQTYPIEVQKFMQFITNIYSTKTKFNGSDIWTFFKDMPSELLKKSSLEHSGSESVFINYKNKMIILTDGYLQFDKNTQAIREGQRSSMQVAKLRNDSNWEHNFKNYKMKAIKNLNFKDLEVLIVEVNPINPDKNTNEAEIIEKYWTEWFSEMDIKMISMLQTKENIPILNSTLSSFIKN